MRARTAEPMTACEINAFSDALVAESMRRYPGRTIEAVRKRVAWQAGFRTRRRGGKRTCMHSWPDDGRAEAWRRGWDAAGGTWAEVDHKDIMPKPLEP